MSSRIIVTSLLNSNARSIINMNFLGGISTIRQNLPGHTQQISATRGGATIIMQTGSGDNPFSKQHLAPGAAAITVSPGTTHMFEIDPEGATLRYELSPGHIGSERCALLMAGDEEELLKGGWLKTLNERHSIVIDLMGMEIIDEPVREQLAMIKAEEGYEERKAKVIEEYASDKKILEAAKHVVDTSVAC